LTTSFRQAPVKAPLQIDWTGKELMENKVKNAGTAKLEVNGKKVDLPVYSGTHGPNVIDIRKLRKPDHLH
jgi:hypothetical protein